MKTEYVTPPYSEAMIKVCNNIEKKINSIIKVQTDLGVSEKEAKKKVIPYLTKDIKLPR